MQASIAGGRIRALRLPAEWSAARSRACEASPRSGW